MLSQEILTTETSGLPDTLPHHQYPSFAKDFGLNPDKLGTDLGMTAILHTHTRRLDYHPHVHVVVPGGGIDADRKQWKKTKGKFLFNEFALAKVFRARFLTALNEAKLSFSPWRCAG